MRRIILVLTVMAIMAAMMVALSGAALAVPGNAKGSGGHVQVDYLDCPYGSSEDCNVTFTGGGGSSDKGSGGGGHTEGDYVEGMIMLNGGGGSGGSTVSGKGGGGGGGCTTVLGVRECGRGEASLF